MTESSTPTTPLTAEQSRLMTEDLIGKIILSGIFIWLFSESVIQFAAVVLRPSHNAFWVMLLLVQTASLTFITLILGLTLTRKPPLDAAPGVEARVSAFLGTFLTLSLGLVAGRDISEAQTWIAGSLVIVGTVLSVWCIIWLGRAFSVMATARELKIKGPYALVRHPLYTAEAIAVIGLVLLKSSLLAFLIGALQFFFQYRRILHEEKILTQVFPDYHAYKARTPMLIPRLFRK